VQKEHDDVSASFGDVNLILAGHTQSLDSHENLIGIIQGQIGDIDLALDGILAIQNSLLGVSE